MSIFAVLCERDRDCVTLYSWVATKFHASFHNICRGPLKLIIELTSTGVLKDLQNKTTHYLLEAEWQKEGTAVPHGRRQLAIYIKGFDFCRKGGNFLGGLFATLVRGLLHIL